MSPTSPQTLSNGFLCQPLEDQPCLRVACPRVCGGQPAPCGLVELTQAEAEFRAAAWQSSQSGSPGSFFTLDPGKRVL